MWKTVIIAVAVVVFGTIAFKVMIEAKESDVEFDASVDTLT